MVSLIKGISSRHPDLLNHSAPPQRKRLKHFSSMNDHLESHVGQHFRDALSYRYSVRRKREPVPVRKMTHALSSSFHPGVPHFWLCDGRLLVLEDPTSKDNVGLFRVRRLKRKTFMRKCQKCQYLFSELLIWLVFPLETKSVLFFVVPANRCWDSLIIANIS